MNGARERFGLWRRGAALVAWMALAASGVVDARGDHACPHHDKLPVASNSAGGFADSDMASAPRHQARSPDHGSRGSQHEHSDGPCTCVGGACSAAPPALPSTYVHATVADGPATPGEEIGAEQRPLDLRREYLHPFATAPPTV